MWLFILPPLNGSLVLQQPSVSLLLTEIFFLTHTSEIEREVKNHSSYFREKKNPINISKCT